MKYVVVLSNAVLLDIIHCFRFYCLYLWCRNARSIHIARVRRLKSIRTPSIHDMIKFKLDSFYIAVQSLAHTTCKQPQSTNFKFKLVHVLCHSQLDNLVV
ncbi:hypothetical protein K439DRAFT_765571 [Ramaria rubella]|nr:hypothetical protein K439DRAFT_765571 [Ramaria rubella]